MASEHKKDFNLMLHTSKDMPRVDILTDEKVIERYGGARMFFAPPIYYNDIMKQVPQGKVITVAVIRKHLAAKNNADFTEPMTAGAFIGIAAWASEQRDSGKIPYWRTLKSDGEINPKFPGGLERQKKLLEYEGHKIIVKGRKNIRYYVADYESKLATID